MTATKTEIRRGTYYDSVVLMQLQVALADLPGVLDVGVMMGTQANKELMAQSGLLTPEAEAALADDLLLVVKADDTAAAESAWPFRGATAMVDIAHWMPYPHRGPT